MRKWPRILFGVLLAAILGALVWLLFRPAESEPVYQGKPLTYWLQGFTRYSNATGGPGPNEAGMAVHSIGTNAIPALLRLLQTPDRPLADRFFAIVQKQQFIHVSHTPSSSLIMQGWQGLNALGPEAAPVVPQLMEIYDRQPNTSSREVVPAILGSIGSPAKSAVPLLVRAATDPDDYVRNNAVYALGRIGAEPTLAVPALIKSLDDPYDNTRMNAARALAGFGKDAQPAVPALLKLLAREQTNSAAASGSPGQVDIIYGPGTPNKQKSFFGTANVIAPATAALKTIDPEAAAKAGIK